MSMRAAVVLKAEQNKIIVLTASGEFRSVKWDKPLPMPGEEIMLKEDAPINKNRMWALALTAVFLLVAVIPSVAWALQPTAYIALDINPSIGLQVARSGKIRSGEGLNEAGQQVLHQVQVRGLLPPEAVERLVETAANEGFVGGSEDDVIVISQVNLRSGAQPTLTELEAAASRALTSVGKEVFVAVEEASREELLEARKHNVSVNKVRLDKKLTDMLPSLASDTNIHSREKIGHETEKERKKLDKMNEKLERTAEKAAQKAKKAEEKANEKAAKKINHNATKDSLQKALMKSGKKPAEVFRQGSIKGKQLDKANDHKNNSKPVHNRPESQTQNRLKPDPKKESKKLEDKKPNSKKPGKDKGSSQPPASNKKPTKNQRGNP
ncbi:MAG: anti-sigma factor domain-containing protein [bacterium]|jgi:hypothetical protein